jgi:hypothetical protein
MNNNISAAMRFFFFVIGSVILLGIWLTGFGAAHWLLYVPVVFFYLATVTGICPGLNLSKKLFPSEKPAKVASRPATKARRKKR